MVFLLSFTLLFSVTAFADDTGMNDKEQFELPEGEVIAELIPLPEDYPIPEYIKRTRGVDMTGYYINSNGVAARRPYGFDAPVIGRLYKGDIVWTQNEMKAADGCRWIHVDTDHQSNMGYVVDVWIITDYLGSPFRMNDDR